MILKSIFRKVQRVYKIALMTLLVVVLSLSSMFLGITNIVSLNQPVGDVELYSRFDLAILPMGVGLFIFAILGCFYVLKEERWEDRHGPVLPLSIVGAFIIAFVVTMVTPTIYESKFKDTGLTQCSGLPAGYLPLFGEKFAINSSDCK